MTGPVSATTSSIANPAQTAKQDELKTAAQAFEAIFLRQMLSSMRSASLGEDIFGSSANDQFRDMADARTADEMSKTGGFGIAELLLSQFNAKPAPAAALIANGEKPE